MYERGMKLSELAIRRVSGQSPEYNKNIVDVEFSHDFVSLVFARSHSLADSGNMRIVPSIIVH